jgi:hypothetical protein
LQAQHFDGPSFAQSRHGSTRSSLLYIRVDMQIVDELGILINKYLTSDQRQHVAEVLASYRDEVATLSLPSAGESAAVAISKRKTAALVYERVWSDADTEMPRDIRLWGGTDYELDRALTGIVGAIAVQQFGIALPNPFMRALVDLEKRHAAAKSADEYFTNTNRTIADLLASTHGISAVPVYNSAASRDREYRVGDTDVIVAVISDLRIPDEWHLTWDQVVDFRRDRNAKAAFRRLTHWLDTEMIGRSWTYIHDEIAIRLEAYEKAMSKHGIHCVLGSLAASFDAKALAAGAVAATSAVFAGYPTLGLLAGGSFVLGKASVDIARVLLSTRDALDETQQEIAFVIQAKEKLSDE